MGEVLEMSETINGCTERFLGSRVALPGLPQGFCGSPVAHKSFAWEKKIPLLSTAGKIRVRQGQGALGATAQSGPGFPSAGGEFGAESWEAQSRTHHEPRAPSTKPLPSLRAGSFYLQFLMWQCEVLTQE